jgi:transposase
MALTLTADERTELERRARSRRIRAEDARRAQVILMLAEGASFTAISATLGCYPDYINRWRQRFDAERLAGLRAKYCGQPPTVRTPAMEARILSRTRQRPPDGSTHWSTRKLAKVLGISHVLVARVWRRAGLQPHRFERYMLSDDPDFEQKAADVIGLYLNPPQHAAVFAADEKTAIQALDRLDPVLPLSPGRAERHGFEYYRHGTLSLYAALNTSTGEIIGQTVPRHTSEAFVEFLGDVVATQPRRREIHVIVDNLSAHKTKRVEAFLEQHPRVHLHFTPTYSSWLNLVERFFGLLTQQALQRGSHTSLPQLRQAIIEYVDVHNELGKPFKWSKTADEILAKVQRFGQRTQQVHRR